MSSIINEIIISHTFWLMKSIIIISLIKYNEFMSQNFSDFILVNICVAFIFLVLYILITEIVFILNYSRLFYQKRIPNIVVYIKNYFSIRRQKKFKET